MEEFFDQYSPVGKPAFLLVVLDGFRLRVDHMIFVNVRGASIDFGMRPAAEGGPQGIVFRHTDGAGCWMDVGRKGLVFLCYGPLLPN